MPDRDDRLPGDPEPRFSEGQETVGGLDEKGRIGDFASREASADEIGPLGEPGAHEHGSVRRDADLDQTRPGSVSGDVLRRGADTGASADRTDRRVDVDDQEGRPEQERHRRFSEGQEHEGETTEKERQGDFASGQRQGDDDH